MPRAPIANKHNPFSGNVAQSATVTVGAEAGNVINVAIQLQSGGKNIGKAGRVEIFFSDNLAGDNLSVTAVTTIAVGTNGHILTIHTAGKHLTAMTEANGLIDLNLSYTSAKTWYMVIVFPDGSQQVQAVVFV